MQKNHYLSDQFILGLVGAACRWWIRPQFSPLLIVLMLAVDAYFESLS